jgi:CRP-like cAMP-binding protein
MFTQLTYGVPTSRIETLRQVALFDGLPDDVLARIDSHMSETTVRAGSVVMTEGEPGREAVIIADGRAVVCVGGRPVASVTAGALLGETALLDGGPRTATVVALTTLRLYVLDPAEFAALFDDAAAGYRIAVQLARRLRATAPPCPDAPSGRHAG